MKAEQKGGNEPFILFAVYVRSAAVNNEIGAAPASGPTDSSCGPRSAGHRPLHHENSSPNLRADRRPGLSAFILHPSCLLAFCSAQVDRIVGKPFATRSAVLGRHGMVCTSVPAASQVGLDVLKRGGNAVDAAIAANATLGLMEPISNGVGGDLFAIVYIARRKTSSTASTARAVRRWGFPTSRCARRSPSCTATSCRPPACCPSMCRARVDAWATLHDKFGKLTLADDLSGAMHYAEEGFPVTRDHRLLLGPQPPRLQGPARRVEGNVHLARDRPAPRRRATFSRIPALAHTLRLIGEKGRDGFYNGEIADQIDAFMQANGGYLRKADLAAHHSEWVDPVSSELPGLRRVRTAGQRPGHGHAANPQHPGRLRPQGDGLPERRRLSTR